MHKLNLPEEFLSKMKEILKDEFEDFIKVYDSDSYKGFRVNTAKISVDEFIKRIGIEFEKVPWCEDGFYIKDEIRLSKHPYYFAGLIYIQEPSAMFPVEALDVKEGEKVLDLCAAPGGKTIQIAAKIGPKGMLVSNDIKPARIKALVKNVENLGLTNVVILNNKPKEIAESYGAYFDKILVDAPCSGEGMFRKDPASARKWTSNHPQKYVNLQRSIMTEVDELLKVGGEIVYSTCTFEIEENEGIIDWFLRKHKNYEVVEIKKYPGFSEGITINGNVELKKAVRIYPHKVKGEGHFVCKLRKVKESGNKWVFKPQKCQVDRSDLEIFERFSQNHFDMDLKKFENRVFYKKADKLYLGYEGPFDRITPIRNGLLLGEIYKGRFYPSAHLVSSLEFVNLKKVINFSVDDERLIRYLKGETIENIENLKGFVAMCVDGFTLGWGKAEGNIIKNYFPRGWRLE
ncbi:RsmF rRNA methyltransferase first C-terminal domain-containing protein [Caldicellulosiruptor morganii]|uniref:RsmB/NOP family class I SAM-dependent RNA methyltransferase n=1 Tax=Caldicellulosiruptor morganii TaxID=1387555 RepID=A0ABY7BMI9_9FIRM|nr:RsmF rRNA methyltransferase first C-terminal domain-containing protein [Caldicellulosiruptor morganii]WAM32955.1 RsmB/NOP family class I SAM-dependent RNA methyltransferase [Caldicellulosiruptor morganii]